MKINQLVTESLADEFAAMARAKGMNPRIHGTPEEERARSQQRMAQRAADREKASADAASADLARLPELKAEYEQMKAEYDSLGGSNWQYADREQNLTDRERQARGMEHGLNSLGNRIARAEKSQGLAEGFDDVVKGVKRFVKGKPSKGERETHHLLRAVGTAKAGTPGMSGSEKEFIEKEFLKHANRHDKVKNVGNKGVAEGLVDTQKKIEDTINQLENRLKHAKTPEQWDNIKNRIERLQAGLKRSKQGVAEDTDNITAVFSGYGNYMKGRGANVFKHYGITVLDKQYFEDEDIAEYTVSGSKEALDQARAYLERSDQFGGMILQQGVAEGFDGEYDDEAGMADNNLETLKRAVEGIDDVINAGDNLPEWCQEKIAVSKSMLVSVWDYMRSEKEKN